MPLCVMDMVIVRLPRLLGRHYVHYYRMTTIIAHFSTQNMLENSLGECRSLILKFHVQF